MDDVGDDDLKQYLNKSKNKQKTLFLYLKIGLMMLMG